MIRFLNGKTVAGHRYGKGAIAALDSSAEASLIAQGDAVSADLYTISPYYAFHGFAGAQAAGDGKFFDLAAGNHGIRGANLSDAQMFATAGYASTVDPGVGATDSSIRIPGVNFDYANGEKLLVWWLGKCTPEAAQANFMGDGTGLTAGIHGVRIAAVNTGKVSVALYGNAAEYGNNTLQSAFDGTLHSFGLVIDGENRKHCFWVDEALDSGFGSGYAPLGTGSAVDTTNPNTWSIGASGSAPGGSNQGDGIATQTRAFVMLRFPKTYPVPSITAVTNLLKALRANPGRMILNNAI